MFILLDIDGVMVSGASWKPVTVLEDGFPAFNESAVIALQKIISETGASIILTSSHKSKYSIDSWRRILTARGVKSKRISKLNDNTTFLSRKEEVMQFLNQKKR